MGAWMLAVYFVGCCFAGHCMNIMLRACVRQRWRPEEERAPKGGS